MKRNSSFSSFIISMKWFGSVFSTLLSKISWQPLAVLLCIWYKYSGKMMIHTRFGNPLTLHLVPPSGQTFPHEQHLNMVSWRHKKKNQTNPHFQCFCCRCTGSPLNEYRAELSINRMTKKLVGKNDHFLII